MNSFLSGFSRLANMAAPVQQPAAPNILLQAIGAAMRGESPNDFMKNLANSHPQLRQYDLNNLGAAAQQVCQNNGVDPNAVAKQLDNVINPYVK